MPNLTMQQVVNIGRTLMGEATGTAGDQSPFLWEQLAQQACDTIAQENDVYGATAAFDTIQNQPIYCGPNTLYRITEAYYTDASTSSRQLIPAVWDDLDDRYRGWQNSGPGKPMVFVAQGMNNLLLYPTPDTSTFVFAYTDLIVGSTQYQVSSAGERTFVSTDPGSTLYVSGGTGFNVGSYPIISVSGGVATVAEPIGAVSSTGGIANLSQGGVTLVGYRCPDTSWAGVPGTPSYSPTATCPLHPIAHMAVVYGACLLRVIQLPTAENLKRLPMLEGMYKEQVARVEEANGRFTPANRHSDRRKQRPFAGGYA